MAKAKHRRLAAIARNKDNAPGSLVDASISGTDEEDSWVIVKKQRITILVPPLSAPINSKTRRLRTNKVQSKSKKAVKCRSVVQVRSSQDGWKTASALASTENIQIDGGSLASRPDPEKKKLQETATTKRLRTNKLQVKSKRTVKCRLLVPNETHPSKYLEDGWEKTSALASTEDIQIEGVSLDFRPDSVVDMLPQPATTARLDLPDWLVQESLMQPPSLDFISEEHLLRPPLKTIGAPRVNDDKRQPSFPSYACDEHMFGTYTPLKTVAAPTVSEKIKLPFLPPNACHDVVGCLLRGSLQNRSMRALNLERKLERAGGLSRWLVSQGLGQFVQIFQRKKINKFQLVNLTMSKLKDMGADAVGPRRKLIHALDCLCRPYHF
ncbi:uncharacterized protein LOC122085388 [Macadamia integrifolia]|uniref:uncharacterized protein LOC122085388 n=1 Tax=Macadamia integrifolia TaxID=60698 RepID=UPI001C4E6CF8|nr:uncharacterized protein LOC122085388 [Macadamia integrifolia]XP_042509716.1 uncharacterized protein LOC122085388 [Macadamia integrifolia]XP_042509717.1 uncharacterized protein LOC122085388 [Macadamia integrifolia]